MTQPKCHDLIWLIKKEKTRESKYRDIKVSDKNWFNDDLCKSMYPLCAIVLFDDQLPELSSARRLFEA